MSNKTLGQALDEYLADIYTVESVYIYQDKNAEPHVVLTISEDEYDYTNVFSEDRNLAQDIEVKKEEVARLQSKIRGLEKDKKSIEKAIATIVKNYHTPKKDGK